MEQGYVPYGRGMVIAGSFMDKEPEKEAGDMSEPLIVGEEVLDYALKLFRVAQMLNDTHWLPRRV